MKLEQLKTKLSFINSVAKSWPVMKHVKVNSKGIACTDFETTVLIKDNYGLNEGYHSLDTIGLVPSVEIDGYPDLDANISQVIDSVTVKLDDLFHCLEFASKDETRINLNVVAFDSGHMVAANGHIMRVFESKKLKNSYLIPRTSLKILKGLISGFKIKGDITFSFNENFAFCETEYFKFKARLVTHKFPRWKTIVPTKFSHEVVLSGMPRLKDIKPILNRNMAVKIESKDKKLTLRINDSDLAFNLGDYSGGDFLIGFNMAYLETAINGEKTFTIRLNTELAAAEVNGAIVMPLKL